MCDKKSQAPNDGRMDDEKRLLQLYRDRVRDRKAYQTRWRKSRESTPRPVGEILEKQFVQDEEALFRIEQARALQAWPRFVGETAALASQALRIRGARLIVQVPDPVWRQQLLFLKTQILDLYRQHFPRLGLKEIFFVG